MRTAAKVRHETLTEGGGREPQGQLLFHHPVGGNSCSLVALEFPLPAVETQLMLDSKRWICGSGSAPPAGDLGVSGRMSAVASSTFPILPFPCLRLSSRRRFGKIRKHRPSGSPPRVAVAQACGETSQHGRERLLAMEASGAAGLLQALHLRPQRPEQTHRQQRFAGRTEECHKHRSRE